MKSSHYSYEIQEMELMSKRPAKEEGSLNPDNDKNPISVVNLLKGAKKTNGKPSDNEHSKVINENKRTTQTGWDGNFSTLDQK